MKYLRLLPVLLSIALVACTQSSPITGAVSAEVGLEDYKCPDCNVILISIDTFRGDHLTCAGYDKYDVDITKNLCDLASDGILFTRAMAQGSETTSSHASIMTSSLLSSHQAFYSRKQGISKDKITIAEVLKNGGYQTGAFTGVGRIAPEFGFSRGFDVHLGLKNYAPFRAMTSNGLKWLNETNGKFFLFLHSYEIHWPYSPTSENSAALDPLYDGPLGNSITRGLLGKINSGSINVTEDDLNHIIAMYDAEILSVDQAFGDLIEQLKSMNLYNNTIIIVTSDHGEEFDEHGMIGMHGHTLYNEILHVPLIVYVPKLKPGVEQKLVRSIDIAPTILALLDIERPGTFEGRSLFDEEQVHAISERDAKTVAFAVQTQAWKYYIDPSKDFESFFNLNTDPFEQQNAIKQHASIKNEYIEIYNKAISEKDAGKAEQIELTEETAEQLRSLGYVA